MYPKQFTINTIAVILNLLIQFLVSFFLTSYLVGTVGATAYGFFALANTIVNYTIILTSALNSMSSRFVGVEYHNQRFDEAIRYYSSVFFGDVFFVLLLLIPSLIAIWNIDTFINVPPELLHDVRALFYVIFANMCINVCAAVFSGVFIIKNRLDLSSIISISSNLFRALLLILLYSFRSPSIVYLGIATLAATILVVVGNVYCNKKLMPELRIEYATVRLKTIWTIVSAGMWNSFNHLSLFLLHGFDLLFSNIMLSAVVMGNMSVAGTLPAMVSTCISSISNLFTPKYLEYFSAQNYDALSREIHNSIKFMTVISCMPICFLVGFGMPFYELWTPNVDVKMVYLLSVCIIIPNFTGAAINSVNYLYTIVNKVKFPAIVLFGTGVLNVIVVYLCLKYSQLGVYSIVIVSAVLGILRNIVFNAPYAAYCIHKKYYEFYPDMLRSFVILLIGCSISWLINWICEPSSWVELILIGGGSSLMIAIVIAWTMLDKQQHIFLLSKLHLQKNE